VVPCRLHTSYGREVAIEVGRSVKQENSYEVANAVRPQWYTSGYLWNRT